MKKILIHSRHGTCYLDYRIVSQAVFLKNAGFDVSVLETFNISGKTHDLYQKNNIIVYSISEYLKANQARKPNIIEKLYTKIKNFHDIRPKFLRELLRIFNCHKILLYFLHKLIKNTTTTLDLLKKIKPDVIITRDLLDDCIKYKQDNPNVKIIADLHEVYYYQLGFLNQNLKNLQDNELKFVSHIINVTPQIAQTYYKHFLDEGRSIIIPNTPSFSIIPKDVPKFEENKTIKIICHGNFTSKRDLKVKHFIEDFIKLNPENCVLYLRFVYNQSPDVLELKEFCKKNDTQQKIIFLEPVDGIEAEISSTINSFDIGLSLFNAEMGGQYTMASPNRFGVYLHSGLAILTNESLFMGELVNNHNLGIVMKDGNYADAINFISQNPDKILEYKKNAYKFAKETFNYENYGKELLKII